MKSVKKAKLPQSLFTLVTGEAIKAPAESRNIKRNFK